jgi:hypothetical protein
MRAALLARFVLEYRLTARDPLAPSSDAWERQATDIVFPGAGLPHASCHSPRFLITTLKSREQRDR